MLRIETAGTWYEMGQQVGEAFPDEICAFIQRFTPEVLEFDIPDIAVSLRHMAEEHAPEVLEETAGMAFALGMKPDALLCYRLFVDANAIRARQGCSVFMVDDAPEGALLARTCDIEPDTHDAQIIQLRRPKGEMATISLTYVGLVSSIVMNEAGVGLAGASARPRDEGTLDGPGMNIVAFGAMQRCETVREAEAAILAQPLLGKGAVQILADANGDCRVLEFVHGKHAVSVSRPEGQTWQAATNFFVSPETASEPRTEIDYNSHARYGRIVHQLMTSPASHSVAGAQTLLADISQPGRYIPEGAFALQTAYASVFELAGRVCHFCPGNPSRLPFERITI